MKVKKRIRAIVAVLLADETSIDRVEAVLNEPVRQKSAEPHDGWFREQRMNTFERQRAEKEAREEHIQFRNIGWREAQLPAHWELNQ